MALQDMTTLPTIFTVGAIIGGTAAAIFALIRIGDRLWRKSNTADINTLSALQRHCENHQAAMGASLQRLSDAMTRYIELQQATLKIEEYRHESIIKQLTVLQGQIAEVDKNRASGMRELHGRLDLMIQNLKAGEFLPPRQ